MKKIIVIGCPGSGKSTLSKQLHKITGIPLHHLDMMYWNADKTTVEKAVFHKRLSDTLEMGSWIIDGNYMSTMELRLAACDTVIFLDYPSDVCIEGIKERRGKPRSDMPWVENEEDAEFTEFVKNFSSEQRPKVYELLGTYCEKNIIILKSREEADKLLACEVEVRI